MPTRSIHLLRQIAAVLATVSGLWQIAGLWMGPLNEPALLTALSGAAYLLIGLGLFGQSRFTLFMAILLPATMLWLTRAGATDHSITTTLRAMVDVLVIVFSARVLWAVRREPSV